MTLATAAEQLLAWWQLGCVDSERVIAWADSVIADASKGSDIPGWLCELSLRGPSEFVAANEPKFPQPKLLTYVERFRAMVEHCTTGDYASYQFAVWCAREAMGEDLDLPEVMIGYDIEHAFSYRNSRDPIEIARNALKEYQPHCHDIAQFFDEKNPETDH